MNFKSRTEKEIQEANLMPKGVYPFEVISAENAVSKKGNDMIEAVLRIFQPDGKTRQLTVYLMEAMPAQLFHFCTYCGLAAEYGNGTLDAAQCVGKTGYVDIGIKEDKTGQYPPQNNVRDFVRPPALKPGTAPHPVAAKEDGDVPY
jgi:hypothetical protein